MAGTIWGSFKDRMGRARGTDMGFNLQELFRPTDGLNSLTRPFEKEEMDLVIKHMHANKAQGPYGFN